MYFCEKPHCSSNWMHLKQKPQLHPACKIHWPLVLVVILLCVLGIVIHGSTVCRLAIICYDILPLLGT